MNKLKTLFYLTLGLAACYMLLAFTMPVLSEIANDSANEVAANANVIAGAYPGAEEGPRFLVLLLWVVPGAAYIVACVVILKRGESTE